MTDFDRAALTVEEGLSELRRSLAGPVLDPTDTEYDAARICFNAMIDRRPAVIAQCAGPADVATAFDFARVHDLQVAVRGGGHNPAGHCVLDGGLVIDLSLLRGVEVDGDARIARAQGGSTWVDFDQATQAHGLVTPGGVVGSTGVCGLALGGGIGHLTAQHGLTSDNVIAAELVIPDASLTRTTQTMRSCSGSFVVRGATSGWRPASSSVYTDSTPSSAESSCSARRAPPTRFAASAMSSRARLESSAARRSSPSTRRCSRRLSSDPATQARRPTRLSYGYFTPERGSATTVCAHARSSSSR